MAVSFIASTVGGGHPTNTTNVPAGVADGDLLLWFITDSYGTVTIPSGWEELDQNGGGALFMRIAASEPASYSVTVPASPSRSVMQCYRGSDQGDPIMAFRGHIGATSNKKTDPLFFQQCDYMLAAFNGQVANLSPTAPSGWTQAGLQAGSSGGDRGVGGAYLAVSNTEGAAASADWGGNANPCVMVVAIRADGQTTLSLKGRALTEHTTSNRPPFPNNASNNTSLAMSTTPGRRWGDLEVLIYGAKKSNDGTAFTFGTPSGFAKKGSDQIYTISAGAPFLHIGIGVAYRILASGNDGTPTATTNLTVAILCGYTLTFSTGTAGPLAALSAGLPGTMGQASDTSNDTTQTIPAMAALEDYVENNILLAALVTDRGDPTVTAPSGWDTLAAWQSGNSGNVLIAWFTKLPLNGGTNPASVNAATNINQRNVAVQFAVARVPGGIVGEGAGPEAQAMILG